VDGGNHQVMLGSIGCSWVDEYIFVEEFYIIDCDLIVSAASRGQSEEKIKF
jgi:hypothetical protein